MWLHLVASTVFIKLQLVNGNINFESKCNIFKQYGIQEKSLSLYVFAVKIFILLIILTNLLNLIY